MPISSYLASTYLNPANPSSSDKKSKKKKSKHATDSTAEPTLTISDDASLFPTHAPSSDDDAPTIATGPSGTGAFRKKKASTWKTVGSAPPTNAHQGLADEILARAERERQEAGQDQDDAPVILDQDSGPEMTSGAKAGLQTASAVRAQLEKKAKAERQKFETEGAEASGKNAETIYRDASGRIISVADAKANARRRAEEKEAQQREEQAALGGDVQAREREERGKRLEDAKFMNVARYKDDEEMNRELKGVERWGDTMAGMVNKKEKKGKTYQGGFAPNRYGIRPGYRWDGVDRGNGFERKWFEAQNRKKSHAQLEYEWQMDE